MQLKLLRFKTLQAFSAAFCEENPSECTDGGFEEPLFCDATITDDLDPDYCATGSGAWDPDVTDDLDEFYCAD